MSSINSEVKCSKQISKGTESHGKSQLPNPNLLKSPKKVLNHYPKHLLFRWIVLRIIIWQLFLEIWATVKNCLISSHLYLNQGPLNILRGSCLNPFEKSNVWDFFSKKMAMLETWPASSAGSTLFGIFPEIQLTQFHNGLELRILLGVAGLTVTKKVCLLLYYTTAAAAQLQAQWDQDWKINPKIWLFLAGAADRETISCLKVLRWIREIEYYHFFQYAILSGR